MTTSCTPKILRLLAHAGLALMAPLAWAASFDIPVQPAPAALKQFIKQSGVQVVYLHDELKGVTTKAVKGEFAPNVALSQLLDGSGFVVEPTGNGNYTVTKPIAPKPGAIEGSIRDESGKPVAGAKVAIADSDKAVATDKRGRFLISGVAAGTYVLQVTAEGLQNARVTDVTVNAGRELSMSPITIPVRKQGTLELETYSVSAKKNDGTLELDPYSVSGTKQKPFVNGNMDIPRTINDAQPYYVFDAKTIDTSGATNLEDFLKQRLTMNTVAQAKSQSPQDFQFGNTSSIDLRGLGMDKTLILVNGRRLPGVSVTPIGGGSNQPNLNGIALSAIERVEVLPSSASGIYGGSAIGGVINIILKKDYIGGDIRVTYDNTFDADTPNRSVAINYGMALEGGKTHVNASASWADAQPFTFGDRLSVHRENLAAIQRNVPTYIYDNSIANSNPWLGALPNIMRFSPTLVLKAGGVMPPTRFTFIPAGTSPSTSAATLGAGLVANAGLWNLDYPATTQLRTGLLQEYGASSENKNFHVGIRREMLSNVEIFADYSYSDSATEVSYNPYRTPLFVPSAAPTNPFTLSVNVRVPLSFQPPPATTRSQDRTATVGTIVKLPGDWTAAIDYTWSENRYRFASYPRDFTAENIDLSSGVLNPFVDTLLYPLSLQKYIGTSRFSGSTQLDDFALRGTGPLPGLPWGIPRLTAGLERRIATTADRIYQIAYTTTTADNLKRTYFDQESTTDSAYLEATVPLVKSAWLPAVHSLDLQLSGRSEHYTVGNGTEYMDQTISGTRYGGVTLNGQPYVSEASYRSSNHTVGLMYRPIAEVTFRISQATAFLPPSPSQLVKNPQPDNFSSTITDPQSSTTYSVQTISGGNANLTPQNSKSLNLGIIWEPRWKRLSGLRLNAEYYKIEQFDAISSLNAQQIVTQESLYPGRVTRNSGGTITLVDTSLVNLYHRETEGWDLSADYSVKTGGGRFSLHAVQSIIMHLKNQYSQTLPEFDAAGFHWGESGATKRKANATLTWESGSWSAGWTARHFGSYKMWGAAGGPNATQSGNVSQFYIAPQGSDTVSSQTYHDLFVGFTTEKRVAESADRPASRGARLLRDMTVQFGVRNVFEKSPPLDAFFEEGFYASPYGDMRLRSYWLSVKKAF